MAESIYLLCAATSVVVAWLLLRAFVSRRTPLLLWSSAAFIGLAINNVLVFLDLSVLRQVDLSVPRTVAGAVSMLVLLYGLIWEHGR